MLKWLTSFLSNRKQWVVLDGTPSEWSDVISGVPQGTILGPILFLFDVNDIPERIQSTAKLFADDCKIYRCIHSREDYCMLLQNDLDSLSAWSRMRLVAPIQQIKVVVLRIRTNTDFRYSIDGHYLDNVNSQKDL